MNREDFDAILRKFGLPYAFWEFDNEDENEIPELPYIVYYDINPTAFYADNIDYHFSRRYVVEFYSEKKEDELLDKLEAFFNSHNFVFTHEPTFIPEEELFMEYYEITII